MSKGRQKRVTVFEAIFVSFVGVILVLLVTLATGTPTGSGAMRARVEQEIRTMSAAIRAFEIDNGRLPRNADTDALDPRTDLLSSGPLEEAQKYRLASKELYRELSGDHEPPEAPDGVPELNHKIYMTFPSTMQMVKRSETGQVIEVVAIMDPCGSSYGYSTAGLASDGRGTLVRGYNMRTYDLWSTFFGRRQLWVTNWTEEARRPKIVLEEAGFIWGFVLVQLCLALLAALRERHVVSKRRLYLLLLLAPLSFLSWFHTIFCALTKIRQFSTITRVFLGVCATLLLFIYGGGVIAITDHSYVLRAVVIAACYVDPASGILSHLFARWKGRGIGRSDAAPGGAGQVRAGL